MNQSVTTTTQDNIREELEKKISYVTQSFSQNFLKNKLKNLARKNPDNANVICDYIIVEQTEFNIKDSTKKVRKIPMCKNNNKKKKTPVM